MLYKSSVKDIGRIAILTNYQYILSLVSWPRNKRHKRQLRRIIGKYMKDGRITGNLQASADIEGTDQPLHLINEFAVSLQIYLILYFTNIQWLLMVLVKLCTHTGCQGSLMFVHS